MACGRGSVTTRRMGRTRKHTGCFVPYLQGSILSFMRKVNFVWPKNKALVASCKKCLVLNVCTHCTDRLLLSSPTNTSPSSFLSSSPFRIMSRLYLTFAMAAINWHWVLIESSGGMNTHTHTFWFQRLQLISSTSDRWKGKIHQNIQTQLLKFSPTSIRKRGPTYSSLSTAPLGISRGKAGRWHFVS